MTLCLLLNPKTKHENNTLTTSSLSRALALRRRCAPQLCVYMCMDDLTKWKQFFLHVLFLLLVALY